MVYRYADEIFSLGREMQDALRGRPTNRPARLLVGISDAVPKLICHRLLRDRPADLEEPVELVLHEGKTKDLLASLAVQDYDMVLTDAPAGGSDVRVKAYNHSLGGCGVGFFGEPALARTLPPGFPGEPRRRADVVADREHGPAPTRSTAGSSRSTSGPRSSRRSRTRRS